MSCDLLPSDIPGIHYQGDVRDVINMTAWDLVIAFPPCTYLCSSGMHWTTRGLRDPQLTEDALDLVRLFLDSNIPHVALENPIGVISSRIRKPDQIIQPWMFGHPESKGTCLWLKNLPLLIPTDVLQKPASGRWANQTPSGQNKLGPSKDRWKERSKTYQGVAKAMAQQWFTFVSSSRMTARPVNVAENHGVHVTNPITQTASASDPVMPWMTVGPSLK